MAKDQREGYFPLMWQRVFVATLILVLLAQITPLVLLHFKNPSQEETRRVEVNYFCDTLAANLDGRKLSDAHLYMDLFNDAGPELWFEGKNGEVLGGKPVPGFSASQRRALTIQESPRSGAKIWHGTGTWNLKKNLPLDLLAVGVNFKDIGPATMFIIYPNYRVKIGSDFYKELIILILAGALISYAVARHLAAPLRRLQQEVMSIDEKSLDRQLTTKGTREVVDVARAVNQQTTELNRYTRNMTELVANISHEMRSPLARMQGGMEFVEEGYDSASHQVELAQKLLREKGCTGDLTDTGQDDLRSIQQGLRHLTLLKEELDHMDNLVGTTLLSSRLDLSAPTPPFTAVDMTELCREILRRRRLFIGNRGIEVDGDFDEQVSIAGDQILLHQLLSNIMDNAVYYVTESGRISFSLKQMGHEIRLAIENSHPPFSDEDLNRLFEPFFRAGQATGTG